MALHRGDPTPSEVFPHTPRPFDFGDVISLRVTRAWISKLVNRGDAESRSDMYSPHIDWDVHRRDRGARDGSQFVAIGPRMRA